MWDCLLALQIRAPKEQGTETSLLNSSLKSLLSGTFSRIGSLWDNSISEDSIQEASGPAKVARGNYCEFLVARMIVFYLRAQEADNKLSEEEMLMAVKSIDLRKLASYDYKVILQKTVQLVQLYHPRAV